MALQYFNPRRLSSCRIWKTLNPEITCRTYPVETFVNSSQYHLSLGIQPLTCETNVSVGRGVNSDSWHVGLLLQTHGLSMPCKISVISVNHFCYPEYLPRMKLCLFILFPLKKKTTTTTTKHPKFKQMTRKKPRTNPHPFYQEKTPSVGDSSTYRYFIISTHTTELPPNTIFTWQPFLRSLPNQNTVIATAPCEAAKLNKLRNLQKN